jgi:hypothetical protein
LRRYLCCTRSSGATFEGRIIRLSAFAPMGSATCFPVETLVFWAITMASLHLHLFGKKFSPHALSELASHVRVFGDDIIAPEDCRETLVSTLSLVGCKPNMDKSCWLTPFRESCGSDWFNGTSVTITRNKGYTYESIDKIDHVPVLSDLQRRFFIAGLSNTAELVRKWCEAIRPLPLVPYDAPEIFVDSLNDLLLRIRGKSGRYDTDPRGSVSSSPILSSDYCMLAKRGSLPRLRLRYNSATQVVEVRVPVLIQRNRAWGTEGYTRLLARLLSDSSDRVATADRKVRIAWRVLPRGSWSFMTRYLG